MEIDFSNETRRYVSLQCYFSYLLLFKRFSSSFRNFGNFFGDFRGFRHYFVIFVIHLLCPSFFRHPFRRFRHFSHIFDFYYNLVDVVILDNFIIHLSLICCVYLMCNVKHVHILRH